MQVKEIGSGASARELREKIVEAARRREMDVVLVWRLDRWGQPVTDLLATLQGISGWVRPADRGAGPDHAGRPRRHCTPMGCGRYVGRLSAKPRSPAVSGSGAPRCAESWRPISPRNRPAAPLRRLAESSRLAAVRRVAFEASDSGLLSPELTAGIRRVKGVRRVGVRVGNWLTAEQGKQLLAAADRESLRGKRNHAVLAMLIGCGLRRGELLALRVDSIQLREEHWVIADLAGKAGHVRTVPVPAWVKATVDTWTTTTGVDRGRMFRAINKAGRVWGDGMRPKVIWEVVKAAAARAGIEKLAPHDLRRTCARLCHLACGELDQIQFLLGHVSIQMTERYLGCKQKLRCAVNDTLGIEPERVA